MRPRALTALLALVFGVLSSLMLAAISSCGSERETTGGVDSGRDARNASAFDAGDDDGGGYGGTGPCGPSTIEAGTFSLTYGGVTYGFIVHLPPSYDGGARTPLILNWHGYQATASAEEGFTFMDPVADSAGFIVVYPNSPDESWNGGVCCAYTALLRDDVGFARALVREISRVACIDARGIYATGFSNGAFMTYRLGCEAADVFAAIAPVSGKVGIPNCNPSRSIPVLHFHGTADPLIPYDSGLMSGEGLSVPDTIERWVARDDCQQGPAIAYQMGTVTCQRWSGCDAGATVTLCTAVGEGHCWPGQPSCPGQLGNSTTDVNATVGIVGFFQSNPRPN
jgi:polyhydroxybutyrate depolymerase